MKHKIQIRMAAERQALIAKARKSIDAADKIKFAAAAKEAEQSRAWVKEQTEIRKRMEAEQRKIQEEREIMKTKVQARDAGKVERAAKKAKSAAHADYSFGKRIEDDDEFTTTMAKYLRKDAALTWAGVLKLMREDGIGGGTKRAARLFGKAQREAASSKASSNGKAKAKVKK